MSTTIRPHPAGAFARVAGAPLRWIERARGWRRLGLLALYAAIVGFAMVMTWRAVSLRGLPEGQEPFATVRALPAVPAEDDATVLYERAAEAYRPFPGMQTFGRFYVHEANLDDPALGRWSKASSHVRAWVDENRASLALWQRAADRPAASRGRLKAPGAPRSMMIGNIFGSFFAIARLEASRRREAGDAAGAWEVLRATLRTNRLLGVMEPYQMRFALEIHYGPRVRRAVAGWVDDPKVGPDLLRRALADVAALDEVADHDVESLAAEYADTLRALDDPPAWVVESVRRDAARPLQELSRLALPLDPGEIDRLARPVDWLARFVRREPERSRRVVRLMFANWAAHFADLQAGTVGYARMRPWDDRQVLLLPTSGAEPEMGGLSRAELAAWYDSATYAERVLPGIGWYERATRTRRENQDALLLILAGRLYALEHGDRKHPKPESLLAPYRKARPR